jgi:hypothetical protein
METNWIILVVVLVFAIVLVIYLIKRNMKDKEDLTDSLNEPEIDEDSKPKENEEN